MFVDGIAKCTRYAFGPNRLHLCGPDANREIFAYMAAGHSDKGLSNLLVQFKTMHPYLKKIAEANRIKDPFDERVVEAYWVGNNLLENVGKKQFYSHLVDGLKINKLLTIKEFRRASEKLNFGARMHHSFHVFNIWKRTGNDSSLHTLQSMDKCRISWGEIITIDGPLITVRTKPLIFDGNNKLILGNEIDIKIARKLNDDYIAEIKPGEIISMHWDTPCEILTGRQREYLEKYTVLSLGLANR
mgnify:CR=1 FL=1